MSDTSQIYLTHQEVVEILRVSPHVLRQRMRETPDHISQPWLQVGGSAKRPRYRWLKEQLQTWWQEINSWRVANGG